MSRPSKARFPRVKLEKIKHLLTKEPQRENLKPEQRKKTEPYINPIQETQRPAQLWGNFER